MRRQEFAAWLGAFVLWGGVIAECGVIACRVNVARLGAHGIDGTARQGSKVGFRR